MDPQLEFFWTVVWAHLAAWSFGLIKVFPPSPAVDAAGWNGPNLFFMLCVGFYELQTSSVTNPAYWWKDRVVDLVSRRRRPVADSMWLMSAVDVCGHVTGLLLFYWVLELMGRSDVVLTIRQPPRQSKDLFLVEAVFVEAIVTAVTMLCTPLLKLVGVTGRLNNLIGSFIGVRIMIWGMPYTGAMMNPASSVALTLHWARHASAVPAWTLVVVAVVFVGGPLLGAIFAGLVEGRIVAASKDKDA